jgi:hypothetical protein
MDYHKDLPFPEKVSEERWIWGLTVPKKDLVILDIQVRGGRLLQKYGCCWKVI